MQNYIHDNYILNIKDCKINFNINIFKNMETTTEGNFEDDLKIDNYVNFEYKKRKILSEKIQKAYEKININKATRIALCFTRLEFYKKYSVNKITDERLSKELKLIFANSCRVRLCPSCAWRRSLKVYANNKKIMSEVIKDNKINKFIFLTLTLKNCTGKNLKETITHLLNSFNYLTRRKKIKDAWKGYIRNLEVTYNDKTKTYHPHIHIIVWVSNSYYNKGIYITQKEYTQMFQEVAKINYIPIVNVKKADNGAIPEISKYCLKYSDIINLPDEELVEVIRILDDALDNRRALSYGFKLKEIKQKLKLKDEITENEEIEEDMEEFGYKIIYNWIFNKYERI